MIRIQGMGAKCLDAECLQANTLTNAHSTGLMMFTNEQRFGPPDLTGLGFGVPIGLADLSARRTFGWPIGRLRVRPDFRPADRPAKSPV